MQVANGPVRGRFAPSPTGDLHLGNARTALLAWLQVRSAGGEFVLRAEDLDPTRSRPEYLTRQLAELRWLGLGWDEGPDVGGPFGPYLQSDRQDAFATALAELQHKGMTFPCYCSRKEILAAASAPQQGDDEGPAYPGTCLERADSADFAAAGDRRDVAIRMKVPPDPVCFHDLVMGERCSEPLRETGAFVVRRKDGVAAYQLAVVVDDHLMRITHVLRGADLLASTARQILLYRALGWEPPLWAHVPLMLGADAERLAKRHGAVSLGEMRAKGVRPEAIVGWLAWTSGLLDRSEPVEAASLVKDFTIDRLRRTPTVVDTPPFQF